jgi:CRP/FNR family transcriptional regulator, cyclic AMP receptor protein
MSHVLSPSPANAAPAAPRLVRLLDVEPDFGRGIDPSTLADARRRTAARLVTVLPGHWDPAALRRPDAATGPFAAIVIDGMLLRECRLGGRTTTQLIGPGDMIPLALSDEGLPADVSCRALVPTTLGVLDELFLAAARRWPWLTARVSERMAQWVDRALLLQAINQLPRVESRIVALLGHIAERWGTVLPDGTLVGIHLTHAAIGTLVGARRPTVSLALKELADLGAVRRHPAGWLVAPGAVDAVALDGSGDRPPRLAVVAEPSLVA